MNYYLQIQKAAFPVACPVWPDKLRQITDTLITDGLPRVIRNRHFSTTS